MFVKKKLITVLLLIIYSYPLYAQPEVLKLKAELKEFGSDHVMKHASWGFILKNASDNSIIAEINAQKALIPASTLKVVTTSTAMELLGEQYRFSTLLQSNGKLSNDTLYGNIIIKGSGDPTLHSYLFSNSKRDNIIDKWSKRLKQNKIQFIKGYLIADTDAFDDEITPPNWLWTDMGNYYGAGSCGLNFMDNKFSVYFDSNKEQGSSVVIKKITPDIDELEIINEVYAGVEGSGDKAFVYGEAFSYRRVIRGTIPINKIGFEVEGAMPDPALYCMQLFQKSMSNNNSLSLIHI